MSINAAVTPNTDLTQRILASAAHLVAAMRDPIDGAKGELSTEISDSLDILQDELNEAHLLDSYKRDDGGLGIW